MIRLAVRCRPEHAEQVLTELLELVPDGVEEDRGEDYVEYAVYGPPGELPALPELEAATGTGLVEVSAGEVPDDWADRWRDFHEPILVGDRVWVRPSWVEPAGRGLVDVVIQPGQAFGTGAHATTRMCLELLLDAATAGGASGPLADLGTGSGVLAICAAKLGWTPIAAYDHERAALEAAAANATANAVEVAFRRVNLREQLPPCGGDTVVANLTGPLLLRIAARLAERRPPRRMICSGLLAGEADEVGVAFERTGLAVGERRATGDWVALSMHEVEP